MLSALILRPSGRQWRNSVATQVQRAPTIPDRFSQPRKYMKKCLKVPQIFRAFVHHSKIFPSLQQSENTARTIPDVIAKLLGILAFPVDQKGNFPTWYNSTNYITEIQRNYRRTYGGSPPSHKSILSWVQNFLDHVTVEIRQTIWGTIKNKWGCAESYQLL